MNNKSNTIVTIAIVLLAISGFLNSILDGQTRARLDAAEQAIIEINANDDCLHCKDLNNTRP